MLNLKLLNKLDIKFIIFDKFQFYLWVNLIDVI